MLGAWSQTLPYKQSLNFSSFDFPELNLIFAVYSPLISMVRFLMLKKAFSVKLSLCLYISSRSYQSGVGVWGFQVTSCVFSSFSGCQFHSISRMLEFKGEVSGSCTDAPTVLFNVQEELGYLTAWESGEALVKPGGREKQSKCYTVSAVFTSHWFYTYKKIISIFTDKETKLQR